MCKKIAQIFSCAQKVGFPKSGHISVNKDFHFLPSKMDVQLPFMIYDTFTADNHYTYIMVKQFFIVKLGKLTNS